MLLSWSWTLWFGLESVLLHADVRTTRSPRMSHCVGKDLHGTALKKHFEYMYSIKCDCKMLMQW